MKLNFGLNDRNLAKLFLLPSILIILCLDLYPLIYVFITSFQTKSLFDLAYDFNFNGLVNYLSIFKDKDFLVALKNSLVWTAGTTLSELTIGVTLAFLLNRNFKFRNLARALLIIPYVVPAIVSTLIWRFMYNDLVGLINYILQVLNIIKEPVSFLANPRLAMLVVISVNVWTYTPFVIISTLAALQNIDTTLYDAAAVDGANNRQVFFNIIIPKLAPILTIVLLLRTVWNFQKFDIIWLMTKGGPLTSTTTLPVIIFSEVFTSYDAGRSSAMAIIILVLLAILAMLYIKVYEKMEDRIS